MSNEDSSLFKLIYEFDHPLSSTFTEMLNISVCVPEFGIIKKVNLPFEPLEEIDFI